jgi:hypothetical protein
MALVDALHGIPSALITQLREAAMQGRSWRLEQLAEQVREHSAAAATHLRSLAVEFRYERLLDALDKGRAR